MWGDRRRLGHEKETVCIVSGGGVCEEIDAGWDTRMRLYVF